MEGLGRVTKKILSDRGPQFASRFMEEFTKVLGTTKQLSMAYHPQCYKLRSFELDNVMERFGPNILFLFFYFYFIFIFIFIFLLG